MNNINSDKRKTITIGFLGIFAVVSIISAVVLISTIHPIDIFMAQLIGLLILFGMISIILLVSVSNGIQTEFKVVWEKFQFKFRPFEFKNSNSQHLSEKTFVGFDNKTILDESLSEEGRILRDEIKDILFDGENINSFEKSLALINQKQEVAKDSWIILLNKARLLRFLDKVEEAEYILEDVKNRFSDDSKAISCYYEILAWFEELKLDYENMDFEVLAKDPTFAKQKLLLEKGLTRNPQNHAILMTLFGVAIIQQSSQEAIKYFDRAISANQPLAFTTITNIRLKTPYLIEQAKLLSPQIEEKLEALIKINDTQKKHVGLLVASSHWIVSIIFITMISFSLFIFGISGGSNKILTNVDKQIVSPFLENTVNNLKSLFGSIMSNTIGTNFGNSSASLNLESGGTNFGDSKTNLQAENTGTNFGNSSACLRLSSFGTNFGNPKRASLKIISGGTNFG
jgi:hypothetical protein